jgi:hypothetical protein
MIKVDNYKYDYFHSGLIIINMTIFTMKENTCTKQTTFKLMCYMYIINHKDQNYMLFWSIIDRLSVLIIPI